MEQDKAGNEGWFRNEDAAEQRGRKRKIYAARALAGGGGEKQPIGLAAPGGRAYVLNGKHFCRIQRRRGVFFCVKNPLA